MYLEGNRRWVSLIVKQNLTVINFPPESRLPIFYRNDPKSRVPFAINPLLSTPPPPLKEAPSPFQGKKVNKPPSLLSPAPLTLLFFSSK